MRRPPTPSPAIRHDAVGADRDAATAEALAGLGGRRGHRHLHAAQASALRFLAWRERSKTNCIKAINEMRMALLELGRRMTARGDLDEPKQIFMLTERRARCVPRRPGLVPRPLPKREAAWHSLAELEPPYFVEGDKGVPPLARRPQGASAVEPRGVRRRAHGRPGLRRRGPGAGPHHHRPGDPLALEPGDVLIAPQTDPSWTPLFMPAAAVVVDVGAMNSHAIIVSRELGIPCVVRRRRHQAHPRRRRWSRSTAAPAPSGCSELRRHPPLRFGWLLLAALDNRCYPVGDGRRTAASPPLVKRGGRRSRRAATPSRYSAPRIIWSSSLFECSTEAPTSWPSRSS